MRSTLAVLLASTALLVTACGDDSKPKVYKNVEECVKDHSREDCDKAFSEVQEQHIQVAPHYSALDECVAKYGVDKCVAHHDSSGDWFAPALTGFILGTAISGSHSSSYPVYIDRYGGAVSNYVPSKRRDTTINNYYGGGGSTGGWSNTTTTQPLKSFTAPSSPAPSTVTRGGFGSSASSGTLSNPSPATTAPAATMGGSVARGGFGGSAASAGSGGG